MIRRPLRFDPAWIVGALCALAAVWIAVTTVQAVVATYSALPFMDQWDTVHDYARLRQGDFGLKELFAQHNEHRIVLPRLVFFVDYALFRGDNRFDLAMNFAVQLAHAALLIGLLGGPWRRPSTLMAAAAVLGLLLSLGQWENFVWGFQTQFVGVFALATGAFMMLSKAVGAGPDRRAAVLAFLGAAALLLMATFSMANGLVATGIAIVLALAIGAPLWMPIALAAMMGIVAALYFHGYVAPAGHSSLGYALAHPVDFVEYVLAYLGNITSSLRLSGSHPGARFLPGLAGLAGAAGALAALVRVAIRRGADRREAVLAAVMLFILATAALTALGRLSFGIEQADASRYRTPSGVFWAALIIFWVRAARSFPSRWLRFAAAAVAPIMLLGLIEMQRLAEIEVRLHDLQISWAEDALLSRVKDFEALGGAYPSPDVLLERSASLKTYGKSIYADPRARWIGQPIGKVAPPASGCAGAFDRMSRPALSDNDAVRAEGWAWNTAQDKPVRHIVLTDNRLVVIGFASTGLSRPDVAKAMPRVTSGETGWRGVAHSHGGVVHAFAVLPGGATCELGRLSAQGLPPGMNLQRIPKRQAGDAIPAVVLAAPIWTVGGAAPTAGPPPAGGVAPFRGRLYASWSGRDANTGDIAFGPFTTTEKTVTFGLATGPDTTGQVLFLKDGATGAVLARIQPPVQVSWAWMRIELPPGAVGRPVQLVASDQGEGGGQWMGVTEPYSFVDR